MDAPHFPVYHAAEGVDARAGGGADEEGRHQGGVGGGGDFGHPRVAQHVERPVGARHGGEVVGLFLDIGIGVHLVEDEDGGLVGGADFREGAAHGGDLLLVVGMGDVDDMDEEVGLDDLVEGRLERLDEAVGQLADETHGVGEKEREVVDDHLADGGVEGCEEFVLGEDVALGQEVHEGALPHVGIAHEGDAHEALAVLALEGLLGVEFFQQDFELRDALLDEAAVGLDLRLAGAAHADAAALALKVGPEAGEAREHVLQLCQLDLRLGDGGAGALGEDVEDEGGAVEDTAVHLLLEVAELRGRELVVEDHEVGVEGLPVFAHLLQFAAADVGAGVGAVEALDDLLQADAPGGVEEEGQFGEVLLGALHRHPCGTHGHEDGLLGDFGGGEGIALLGRTFGHSVSG